MGLDTNKGLIFDGTFNKESQMSIESIVKYVGDNYYYAIYIKNLQILNEPRSLTFYYSSNNLINVLTESPKNMRYCYEYKGVARIDGIYKDIFEKKIILSVSSIDLNLIINSEKTIIVSKKVLKNMLNKKEN